VPGEGDEREKKSGPSRLFHGIMGKKKREEVMDTIIKKYVLSLELGTPEQHKNMSVFPLRSPLDGGPEYMTLKEAQEKSHLLVTEVSSGGSVPELKVVNNAPSAVLLLDGEELAGAKQNRVLNTTILIDGQSEVIIPVSCTEKGRWAYVSRSFSDSDTVMSPSLRSEKARTVASSLKSTGQYRSDQGTVWQKIDELAAKADTVSRTGAMKDIYEQKAEDLNEYLRAFHRTSGQKGFLVFKGLEPVGFDFVSSEKAFEDLFPKMVRSYAMEAVLEDKKDEAKVDPRLAEEFLKETTGCDEKTYDSVGRGRDFRYESKALVGSALAVEDKVIHLAFFRVLESDRSGEMASTRRRVRYRL
jgi:hypothetical protein